MDILGWLQALGHDADPAKAGFQAQPLYVMVCVAMPACIGLAVGWTLRIIERIFGVELGKGGGH